MYVHHIRFVAVFVGQCYVFVTSLPCGLQLVSHDICYLLPLLLTPR
jgi:hypothetical protein